MTREEWYKHKTLDAIQQINEYVELIMNGDMASHMSDSVRELMTKIEEIQYIIDELDKMPDYDACTGASQYLEEYIDRLKGMKVDM